MAVETQALQGRIWRPYCAVRWLRSRRSQLELRIGEAGAGFPLPGALVIFVVARPGNLDDAVDLGADLVERGVVETLAQPPGEFLAGQLDVALALADLGGLLAGCIRRRHGLSWSRSG
jgi:hypothetical protein